MSAVVVGPVGDSIGLNEGGSIDGAFPNGCPFVEPVGVQLVDGPPRDDSVASVISDLVLPISLDHVDGGVCW